MVYAFACGIEIMIEWVSNGHYSF